METWPRLKVSSDRLVKPGIEPATRGLKGKRFIHYTTAAPRFSLHKAVDHVPVRALTVFNWTSEIMFITSKAIKNILVHHFAFQLNGVTHAWIQRGDRGPDSPKKSQKYRVS